MPLAMTPSRAIAMTTSTRVTPFSDFLTHWILIFSQVQCLYSGQVAQGSETHRRATLRVTRIDWSGQHEVIPPIRTWTVFIDTSRYDFLRQPHTTRQLSLARERKHIAGQPFRFLGFSLPVFRLGHGGRRREWNSVCKHLRCPIIRPPWGGRFRFGLGCAALCLVGSSPGFGNQNPPLTRRLGGHCRTAQVVRDSESSMRLTTKL